MHCVLCRAEVKLLDLDADGYAGMPAHTWCAEAHRQSIRDALDEANRMVMAEPNPKYHRKGLVPPPADAPAA